MAVKKNSKATPARKPAVKKTGLSKSEVSKEEKKRRIAELRAEIEKLRDDDDVEDSSQETDDETPNPEKARRAVELYHASKDEKVETTMKKPKVWERPEGMSDRDMQIVIFLVDKDMTDGGIRINGLRFVGEVEVPRYIAKDLARIQEEYFETKKKLFDPMVRVRMKSDFQKEMLFLVDPEENAEKKTFSRDYGLLGAKEWSYCSPKFKDHLLTMRKQLYGY